jgi:hypothetical protein
MVLCFSNNALDAFHVINMLVKTLTVAIVALGLQPRQGLARVAGQEEARESHFMLS